MLKWPLQERFERIVDNTGSSAAWHYREEITVITTVFALTCLTSPISIASSAADMRMSWSATATRRANPRKTIGSLALTG